MLAMFTTFLDFFGDPNRGADRICDVGRRDVGIGDRFLGPGERTIMIVAADRRQARTIVPGSAPAAFAPAQPDQAGSATCSEP